jgi:hypothetical protein
MPSHAERESRAVYLDRLSARFGYGVVALTIVFFGGQMIRWFVA